jgi:hypothetical protein
MTNGNRNRSAGNGYERAVVLKLKSIGFPNITTSRNNSRVRDKQCVDIMNLDEAKDGRLPYNIQCKNVSKHVEYAKLLAEMPQDGTEINVVFHKKTKKSEAGIFRKEGEYAILKLDDFYGMMKRLLEIEDEAKSWNNLM